MPDRLKVLRQAPGVRLALVGVTVSILLVVLVVDRWNDGGQGFGAAVTVFLAAILLFFGVPLLARARGRRPAVWILVGALATPFIAVALLLALPRHHA